MMRLRGFTLAVIAFSAALQASSQEGRFVVVNKSSKELRRTAHRLRLPVEQLKNARQALHEATDLAKTMDPCPVSQIYTLGQSWKRLDPSRASSVIESFIRELRSEAADAPNFQYYQQVTSSARMLMEQLAGEDYESVLHGIQSWPYPPASFGDTAENFRNSLETEIKRGVLSRLARSDPETALELLSQLEDSDTNNYGTTMMVVNGLMNAGKKEEALGLLDRAMDNFARQPSSQSAFRSYEGLLMMAAMYMDSDRVSAAFDELLKLSAKQGTSGVCGGTLETDDWSVDLTCAESTTLRLLPSLGMRPGLITNILDSNPDLKSKVEAAGGIDSLLSHGRYGSSQVKLVFDSNRGRGNSFSVPGRAPSADPAGLLRELQGKAESNPGYVRTKLREAAKNAEDADMLIGLASAAAYQDPDLGALALEIARDLLPRIESLQRRSGTLQNLARTYRQIEGETDTDLLRDGYVLADQMRQEESQKDAAISATNPANSSRITPADQLEIFLISELSRDSYEDAVRYVRSMQEDTVKLASFIRIVQALSQPNY